MERIHVDEVKNQGFTKDCHTMSHLLIQSPLWHFSRDIHDLDECTNLAPLFDDFLKLGSLLHETLDCGRGMNEARQVASVRLLDGHTTNWKYLDSHHSKLLVSWSVDNLFWEVLHLRTAFQVNLTGIWPISHHIQNYEPLFSLCLHPQKIGIRPYMALKYETKITKKKEQRFVVQLCIL